MTWKKVFFFFKNLDLLLAGICFIVLVIVTFSGVLMRYLFSKPFVWQEEIQLWMFIWITFFGGSAAFRTRSHVGIEIIVDLLPESMQKAVQILISTFLVMVLGYLCMQSWLLIQQFLRTNKTTSMLSIPAWLVYSAIPIGSVLMIINNTAVMVMDCFRERKRGEDAQ